MSRAVLCTSSSGLDNLNVPHNIELIRLRLIISKVEFIDGKTINRDRLQYIMTDIARSAVRTSPAPRFEIEQKLSKLYRQGITEVFILTLSSAMSESYNIIKSVASSFVDKMNIHVYDCKDLNMCEAILALEAEQMLQQGASFSDTIAHLDKLRDSHKMLFTLNDLSTLVRNKKLSATSGFFASLFKIKPVLTVTEAGEIVPINRIRSFEKAVDHLIDFYEPIIRNPQAYPYILDGGNEELTQYFLTRIKERLAVDNLPVFYPSSISTANHGIHGVGLCAFSQQPSIAKNLTHTS